jgi:SAM-dependent methyltransferase
MRGEWLVDSVAAIVKVQSGVGNQNVAGTLLARIYGLRAKVDSEERFVRRTLLKWSGQGRVLLDVGCGRGRFHDIIVSAGWKYVGVDVNPATVDRNRALGREVYTPAGFENSKVAADAILLSHIVEHFDYSSLIGFLNTYLPHLKMGGLLMILTPFYHRGFYDDFDHVKPYNPGALRQILCRSSDQTQGITLESTFQEVGLWFKRDPVWHSHRSSKWSHLFTVPLSLASTLSFGMVGKLTGYGMILRRVS